MQGSRSNNPDIRWVAAGLLGTLLLAGLAIVVLFHRTPHHACSPSEGASQSESGSSRNENAAERFRSMDLSANLSTSAVTPVTSPLIEQRLLKYMV
jgi:hypothetical protein